jgi:hypothetical protein
VVGAERFVWSVGHQHDEAGCREVVRLQRVGEAGRLVLVFAAAERRLVADGRLAEGQVMLAGGRAVNLHEPGVVRALLDEVRARGLWPASPAHAQVDGWDLLAARPLD